MSVPRKTRSQLIDKKREQIERAEREASLQRLARELRHYQHLSLRLPLPFPADAEPGAA